MSHLAPVVRWSVLAICLAPLGLLATLGVASLTSRRLRERTVGFLTGVAMTGALLAALTALGAYLAAGREPQVLRYGTWFAFGAGGFSFDFVADGLSLGFVTLSLVICGVVSAFSFRYMHLETGFHRYFIQFAMFVVGVVLVALAGSIEVLFAGWELLGLSSALLVGFFHERRAPVVSALRVFAVYRAGDAAMAGAAVLLHHWAGSGSLAALFAGSAEARLSVGAEGSLIIALLILVAVTAKCALLPLSGWLPSAMEGPTPSSAVYYGALSIHAGCFLLLRAEPLLAQTVVARALAALAGLATALYATIVARAQTDVKSAMAYASLTQVGIIVLEIALGLSNVAFVHLVGHASFRLLQFLRAPNVLHERHDVEGRLGSVVREPGGALPAARVGRLWYMIALERGFIDPLLDRFVLAPFQWVTRRLDRIDRLLCGEIPRRDTARERSP